MHKYRKFLAALFIIQFIHYNELFTVIHYYSCFNMELFAISRMQNVIRIEFCLGISKIRVFANGFVELRI